MRLHFQERPWDLYLALGYVAAMAAFILTTGQGLLVAILLVLFVPGYALVAALFPGSQEINWIERIALSFGLSIAVVPLLGLLLNFSFGIFLVPVTLSILIFSVGLGVVAYLRRMRLPVEERLSVSLEVRRPAWGEYSRLDKVLAVGLVISVIFSVSVLAFVLMTPRPGEKFTEFGLLGPGGMLSDYPENLTVSEEGTVLIFVANHEFERVNYTVRVDRVGVDIVFNPDSGRNETVELNRTTMDWMNLTLEHAANSTSPYTFQIDTVGLYRVQFSLFRDGDLTQVYLGIHLVVTVRSM
ncbi:MAG: DUF1616 domain-containing protein [Dehalococcoidia bacterium]